MEQHICDIRVSIFNIDKGNVDLPIEITYTFKCIFVSLSLSVIST